MNKEGFANKKKIWTWMLLIFFLVAIIPIITRSEFLYARNLQVEGVVVSIEWKSTNHQLPKIILLDGSGKEISVSHSSVALNESNVKIDDKLVKKRGNNYCLINGKKVNFSKYLGSGSIFEIFGIIFNRKKGSRGQIT